MGIFSFLFSLGNEGNYAKEIKEFEKEFRKDGDFDCFPALGQTAKKPFMGCWIKFDNFIASGAAEDFASKYAKKLGIENVLSYKYFEIDGNKFTISRNFIKEDEIFLPVSKMIDILDVVAKVPVESKFISLCNLIKQKYNVDCTRDFANILLADLFICNNGRGFDNLGILLNRKNGTGRVAPMFDLNKTFMTNIYKFPLDYPVNIIVEGIVFMPFGLAAKEQYKMIKPYSTLKIDFKKLTKFVKSSKIRTRDKSIKKRIVSVSLEQIQRMREYK